MPNQLPIVFSFSSSDIKKQRLEGLLALFTESALAKRESAMALLNSLHLSMEGGNMKTARFEIPEVRAFAEQLTEECPVLPWVAGLSTPFYREVIYAILPEIHVTYQDRKPGKYAATFRVEDMEEVIRGQVGQIEAIGCRAGLSPEVVAERVSDLTRYLRDGVDLP